MADGLVVIGTVSIVGLVAVTTVALVYNRTLYVRARDSEIHLRTSPEVELPDVGSSADPEPSS